MIYLFLYLLLAFTLGSLYITPKLIGPMAHRNEFFVYVIVGLVWPLTGLVLLGLGISNTKVWKRLLKRYEDWTSRIGDQ